jgi:hypothetical protein
VTTSFVYLTPVYLIEFGDAYQTLQKAGGGVLTQVGGQAVVQQGAAVPAGTLGYAQVTASQTGISTVVDLTGLTITVTVSSGRRIKVTGQCRMIQNTSTAFATFAIQEGATILNEAIWVGGPTIDSMITVPVMAILQPTAGVHTYKLTLATSAGTVDLTASTVQPAFIMAEDIGT